MAIVPQDKVKSSTRRILGASSLQWVTVPSAMLLALLLWQAITAWSSIPAFMLPSPAAVWERLVAAIIDGSLLWHTGVTLSEVLGGLAAGMGAAVVFGYLLAKSRTAEKFLSPFIVASQSVPVVAIAPLLIIWFGPGRLSKLFISALIVFFPVLINTIVGVRSVPEDLRDLMRSLRSTHWQTFRKLEVPAAMPVLLGGLKVGATLSVIGAIVGEFVSADQGLGYLINVARGMYDTPMVFVAVFDLIGMALTLYTIVALLERSLLAWREGPKI